MVKKMRVELRLKERKNMIEYTRNYYAIYDIIADGIEVGDMEVYEPITEEEAIEYEVEDPETDTTWVHCDGLFVKEDYRNRGIGTQALEALYEMHGHFTITPNNKDAQRLYERLGSEDLSWADAYYTDQGFGVYEI